MKMLLRRPIFAVLLLAVYSSPVPAGPVPMPWIGEDLDGHPCRIQQNPNNFGPWDYTNPAYQRKQLPIVELSHFTADVENLVRGIGGSIVGDLVYTMRSFPNHHRALYAYVRYQLRNEKKLTTPPECWLDRALAFNRRPIHSSNDVALYTIYGVYLHHLGKPDLALEKYKKAEALQGNNPELLYNIGLIYLEKGSYEHARDYARKAYALKYPLPGLRQRLQQRGYSLNE